MKFRYEDMSHPLSSFHLFRCKTLGEAFFSNTVTGLKRFPLVSINQLMLLVRMASTSGDIYEKNVQNLLKIHDQKNPNVNLEDMKDKTFKVYHDYYLQCLVENTLISSAEVRDPQMMTVCNIAYSPHEFTADFTKDLELFIRLIKVVTLSKAVNDETTNRCLSSIAQSRQLIVCESARLCLIDPTSALAAYLTWITKIMGRIYNEVTMTLFPHVAPGMSNACTFTLLQFMYTLGLIANNSQTQIYVQNIANGTFERKYGHLIPSKECDNDKETFSDPIFYPTDDDEDRNIDIFQSFDLSTRRVNLDKIHFSDLLIFSISPTHQGSGHKKMHMHC